MDAMRYVLGGEQLRHIVEQDGTGQRMDTLDFCQDRKGAAIERLGLGESALQIIKLSQIIQTDGNRHVIGAEFLLLDPDCPHMQGFSEVIAALLAVEFCQSAHQHSGRPMSLAERTFSDIYSLDKKRLGKVKAPHFNVKLPDVGTQDGCGGMIDAEFFFMQRDDFEGERQRLLKFTLPEERGVLVIIVEKSVGLSPPHGGSQQHRDTCRHGPSSGFHDPLFSFASRIKNLAVLCVNN